MSMDRPEETTAPPAATEEAVPESSFEAAASAAVSQAGPLLMGVKLPIRILLGRAQLCLREVTQLAGGSVVELECSPNDPVEILVNDRVIAHGEVVVVAGNYGVRITRIATREEKHLPGAQGTDLLNLSERLK